MEEKTKSVQELESEYKQFLELKVSELRREQEAKALKEKEELAARQNEELRKQLAEQIKKDLGYNNSSKLSTEPETQKINLTGNTKWLEFKEEVKKHLDLTGMTYEELMNKQMMNSINRRRVK